MIGYIKGKLMSISGETATVLNNGIGYEITCSKDMLDKLATDKEGEIYTYLAVREDGLFLYGFISQEEKNMFLKLISISGIGPKVGITILSNMKVNDLAVKIATSDVKGLSSIKGLGKKTAERIILELREKVMVETKEYEKAEKQAEENIDMKGNEDAIIALMSLGFTRAECIKAITLALNDGQSTIQEIITYSLKHIR